PPRRAPSTRPAPSARTGRSPRHRTARRRGRRAASGRARRAAASPRAPRGPAPSRTRPRRPGGRRRARRRGPRAPPATGPSGPLLPRELLAQLVLEDLAQRLVARQRVDDLELLGGLELREPLGLEVRDHLVEGDRLAALRRLHHGAHALPPLAVRQADDRDVADLRVRVEEVLDLLGGDVLALADDDVLEPPGQHHVAVLAQVADVAGAEVAVLVEGLRRERRVGVALADHRALHPHLAVDPGRGDLAVGGDDPHLGAGDRLAGGVQELLVGVRRTALGDHRHLGHAVAVADLDAHLLAHLAVQ